MSLASFLRRLQSSNQRALIWAQGARQPVRAKLEQEVLPFLCGEGLLVSDQPLGALSPLDSRQAHRHLGRTLDFLLFDAYVGFNPNAFGQLCGTLRGGGVLVLLTPPEDDWPAYTDPEYASLCVEPFEPEQLEGHFLSYLTDELKDYSAQVRLTPDQIFLPEHWPASQSQWRLNGPCRTEDQAQAVDAVMQTAKRRRRPLVLTADRGRGKSAALGIAAAQLLQQEKSVLVTAPDRAAISALESQVEVLAPKQASVLRFLRPDELLKANPQADLLLVDEAAAIPVPVLLTLLQRYPRVVFATTLHGYEGNGQGFSLRFLKRLRQLGQSYDQLHLDTPIRWASPDPLECLCNRLLMLDADPPEPAEKGELRFQHLERARLAENRPLLNALFGLLVLAHYRTTPGDLRILLDSPNLEVFSVSRKGEPLACALVAREGPLEAELSKAVWAGRRRPRGHLMPQTLIAQEGWQEAAEWRGWRIIRIAVHPGVQQQGIGQQLLEHIQQQARAEGVDYMGASFASEPGLLRFWQSAEYWPVRLGEQRDPVAGSHALLVLKPLVARLEPWFAEARNWYKQSLLLRLSGQLQDLEAEYLPELMKGLPVEALDTSVIRRLEGFVHDQRNLESSLVPLTVLLHTSLPLWHRLELTADDVQLLCQRILRQQSASGVEKPHGKKAQLERLRLLSGQLLSLVDAR